jgi:putative oxidoreductase
LANASSETSPTFRASNQPKTVQGRKPMAASVTSTSENRKASGKGLHIVLWVTQVVLALMFTMAGFMKSTQPIDELGKKMTWVLDLPSLTRFIGIAEVAGALGLILPAATRIMPKLTPLAALGLTVVMVLATIFHISRGEFQALPLPLVLGGLAAFVAWGRFSKAPIAPRR